MMHNKPAIIKNFQQQWFNLSDSSSLQDVATKREIERMLLTRFGSAVVRVSVSPTGRFDGPEAGPLWGLPADKDVLVRPPASSMLFADFLRLVKSESRETFYLEYLALQQYLGPVGYMLDIDEL
jgi:hypothetical protein